MHRFDAEAGEPPFLKKKVISNILVVSKFSFEFVDFLKQSEPIIKSICRQMWILPSPIWYTGRVSASGLVQLIPVRLSYQKSNHTHIIWPVLILTQDTIIGKVGEQVGERDCYP